MYRGQNNKLMEEIWKDIKNFQKYQISNLANFRQVDKIAGNIRHLKIFVFYTNYSKYGAVKLNDERFLVESLYKDTFDLEIVSAANKGLEIFTPKPEDKPPIYKRKILRRRRIKNRSIFQRGLNFGKTAYFYDNDNLAEETEWKDKKRNGLTKTYYEEGSLKSEIPYMENKKEGLSKTYYKSGKLKSQIEFKKGKQIREQITWDENGDLMNGFIQSFYKNGILSNIETFKDGKLHGINKSWYKNGVLLEESNYHEGEREGYRNSYDISGRKVMETSFKQDKLDGVSKTWSFTSEAESFIIQDLTTYKEGKLHGIQKIWYENGVLREESHYHEGKRHGTYKYFDKEGNITQDDWYIYDVIKY